MILKSFKSWRQIDTKMSSKYLILRIGYLMIDPIFTIDKKNEENFFFFFTVKNYTVFYSITYRKN